MGVKGKKKVSCLTHQQTVPLRILGFYQFKALPRLEYLFFIF